MSTKSPNTDPNITVHFQLPPDWQPLENAHFDFLCTAPEKKDFTTNVGLRKIDESNLSPERFDEIIAITKSNQQESYENYQLLQEMKYMHRGAPAYYQQYDWKEEASGLHFCQILVFIANPVFLLQIDGATIKELKEEHLSQMQNFIDSIDFR